VASLDDIYILLQAVDAKIDLLQIYLDDMADNVWKEIVADHEGEEGTMGRLMSKMKRHLGL
jgi:hypothetical protein